MKIESQEPAANVEEGLPAASQVPAVAPVEVPAPATPPVEEVSDGSEEINWGQMNEAFDHVDVSTEAEGKVPEVVETPPTSPAEVTPPVEGAVPVEPGKEVPPTAPVTAPTTPVATPEVPPEVPPVAPVAETPTPEVPKPEVPPVQAQTPEQLAEATKQIRTEQHSKLRDFYKISDEDAASMITAPQEVVPSMLANLHMTVLENTLQTLSSMIPQMVSQVMQQTKANEDANKEFFKAWPKLAQENLYDPLGRMIQAYRNANPEVAQSKLISEVGAAAHLAFKIAPDNIPEPSGGVPQVPGAQVPAVVSSFTPASPGGSMPQVPAKKDSVWGEYNKELDTEEARG